LEIKLGGIRKGIAIVSPEDYDKVSQYSWHQNNYGYVMACIDKKNKSLHRFVMNAEENDLIDHKNNNKLDNQRGNLKFSDSSKNSLNRTLKEGKTSKYKGVYYKNNKKKYYAELTIEGMWYYLGSFKDEVDAAEIIDKFMLYKKLDDHVKLNFPEKKDRYLTENYEPPMKKEKKYTGVFKDGDKFGAIISINDKNVYLKRSCLTEEECARAYDEYVVKNNIPNRKLNFPDDRPEYNPLSVIKTKFKEINDKTVRLLISEKPVLIDKDDYDRIKYYNCFVNSTSGYVMMNKDNKTILLHRYLMNETDPKVYIDHEDSNILNNTKRNLRYSDKYKNAQNKSKMDNSTSIYNGVCFVERANTFFASVSKNGEKLFTYRNKYDWIAARRRDLYIMEYLKDDHYKFNFEWDEDEIKLWKDYFDITDKVNKSNNNRTGVWYRKN